MTIFTTHAMLFGDKNACSIYNAAAQSRLLAMKRWVAVLGFRFWQQTRHSVECPDRKLPVSRTQGTKSTGSDSVSTAAVYTETQRRDRGVWVILDVGMVLLMGSRRNRGPISLSTLDTL